MSPTTQKGKRHVNSGYGSECEAELRSWTTMAAIKRQTIAGQRAILSLGRSDGFIR